MKLSLALDFLTLNEARGILAEVHEWIDLVEVGTPLVVREGMRAVSTVRREYPDLPVMADLKIMDAGAYETTLACEAGADIVSVLGLASESTIAAALAAARQAGAQLLVDLIGVPSVVERALSLRSLGVDYLCVHTASDLQRSGGSPLRELEAVTAAAPGPAIAVAGGIAPETLPAIVEAGPEVVIVGSAITGHPKPGVAAEQIWQILHREGGTP